MYIYQILKHYKQCGNDHQKFTLNVT